MTTHVMVATFATEADTERALRALRSEGAAVDDVCILEAGTAGASDTDRGLLAVLAGPGHIDEHVAQAKVEEYGGHTLPSLSSSEGAMDLIRKSPRATDAFQPPEAILPPLLVTAMLEETAPPEQPDLEHRVSKSELHQR